MSNAFERVFGGGRRSRKVAAKLLRPPQRRLHDGTDAYHEFPKQRHALTWLQGQADERLRVFCREEAAALASAPASGQRRYVAANLERFVREYLDYWAPHQRHFYELIPQGAPCRLYLDLEFYPETNPSPSTSQTGDAAVDSLLEAIAGSLSKDFGLEVEPADFLQLDSSTVGKFSRHVVLHLPRRWAFPSNVCLGDWVEERGAEWLAERPELAFLDRDGVRSSPLWDRAVYTRNRNFRLLLSSKAASPAVVLRPLPASQDAFYTKRGVQEPSPERLFMDCLVTLPPSEVKACRLLDVASVLGGQENAAPSKSASQSRWRGEGSRNKSGPSPYPLVEEAVLGHVRRRHPESFVRSWRAWEEPRRQLCLDIGASRFCHNVQRQHRSNGVYWMVDLDAPAGFYQKCHDPDCRGFRSNTFPLPQDCLPEPPSQSQSLPTQPLTAASPPLTTSHPLSPGSTSQPVATTQPLSPVSPQSLLSLDSQDEVDLAIEELIQEGLL